MEKQVYGKPQSAIGEITTQIWLKSVITETLLIRSTKVTTTFQVNNKPKKEIDDICAVYVFRPEKARGENGVILKEYLGIGDVRDILIKFDTGFDQEIVVFPICLPKIVPSVLFNEVSTMMIGGIWRKYSTMLPDEKWTLLALFNVMQFFFYNSSTNDKQREYYLKQFVHVF
jgi:hypothetical protein